MIPVSEIEKVIAELEAHKNMAYENSKTPRLTAERLYHNGAIRGYKHAIFRLKELLPK